MFGLELQRRHSPRYKAWLGARCTARSSRPPDGRGRPWSTGSGGQEECHLSLDGGGARNPESLPQVPDISSEGVAGGNPSLSRTSPRSATLAWLTDLCLLRQEIVVFGPQVKRDRRPDGVEGEHTRWCQSQIMSTDPA
jgi:hypothetical protein